MRTRILFTLPLLVVAACSSETVAPPPRPPVGSLAPLPPPASTADVVTAKEMALPQLYARALSSAADAGVPFAGLAPLLNAELAQFTSPGGRPAHEPAQIIAAHDALFGAFDDRKFTIGRVWRTPNEQTVEWTMTGSQSRDWKGVAATRKAVGFRGVTLLWTKDDGSITDIHVTFDVAALKAQLGAPSPKELVGLPVPTSPTGAPQVFEQTAATATQEAANVNAVKASLDALEGTDGAAYAGTMTDDVEVDRLERAEPARGKDAARAYFKTMHGAIGQLDTSVMNAWGVGSYVVVEYSISGEQLGALGWIKAQRDRVLRFEIVDLCEMRDGKIARVWRYDDPAEIGD